MAVMPLVPKTKMADVGKLSSLRNLLVRKVTWLLHTTTSATLISSCAFGADCMTRIAYIYSHLSRTHSFHFGSQRQHTLLHCDLQRQLTFSILTSTDNILSLTFDFQQSTPQNVYSLQLLSSLFYLYSETCSSLENNHRNFIKPLKEPNNLHRRRFFLLTYIL